MSEARDAWWEVELFRLAHDRLPNEKGDRITKKTAKIFLDRMHSGYYDKTEEDKKNLGEAMRFAFHVYASANKDYEKE